MRAYVEILGILAFPLAACFDAISTIRRKWLGTGLMALAVILVFLQQVQTYQYKKNLIHYNGMNSYVYWRSFMRLNWHPDFWVSLTLPDYDLARKGIYVFYVSGDKHEDLREMGEEKGRLEVAKKVMRDRKLHAEVKRYAKRSGITFEEAMQEVTARMYESMTNM